MFKDKNKSHNKHYN